MCVIWTFALRLEGISSALRLSLLYRRWSPFGKNLIYLPTTLTPTPTVPVGKDFIDLPINLTSMSTILLRRRRNIVNKFWIIVNRTWFKLARSEAEDLQYIIIRSCERPIQTDSVNGDKKKWWEVKVKSKLLFQNLLLDIPSPHSSLSFEQIDMLSSYESLSVLVILYDSCSQFEYQVQLLL